MDIKRQYIINEDNQRVAVQMDIETFEKIEEALENYGLYKLMAASDDDAELDHNGSKGNLSIFSVK
jgi:hypothetical protein